MRVGRLYRRNLGHANALAALIVEDVEHKEVLVPYHKCSYAHALMDILNDDERV